MITCAFPMIWFNERRQVRTYKLISKAEEMAKECPNPDTVDDGLDQELVHTSGTITTSGEEVQDALINGVTVTEALKLSRFVEIYERIEGKEDEPDTF